MTIPIYDVATMPCITYPMKNTQLQSKKYLGIRAISQDVSVEIKILIKSDAEMASLYDFWKTDCNFGLEPFLIPLPVFGRIDDKVKPTLLVKFIGDFSADKEQGKWASSLKLSVIGTIDYIIDGTGNFIVSDIGEYTVTDSGDYIPTGNVINSYREVLYAV